jgi:hypothetical protein
LKVLDVTDGFESFAELDGDENETCFVNTGYVSCHVVWFRKCERRRIKYNKRYISRNAFINNYVYLADIKIFVNYF